MLRFFLFFLEAPTLVAADGLVLGQKHQTLIVPGGEHLLYGSTLCESDVSGGGILLRCAPLHPSAFLRSLPELFQRSLLEQTMLANLATCPIPGGLAIGWGVEGVLEQTD